MNVKETRLQLESDTPLSKVKCHHQSLFGFGNVLP